MVYATQGLAEWQLVTLTDTQYQRRQVFVRSVHACGQTLTETRNVNEGKEGLRVFQVDIEELEDGGPRRDGLDGIVAQSGERPQVQAGGRARRHATRYDAPVLAVVVDRRSPEEGIGCDLIAGRRDFGHGLEDGFRRPVQQVFQGEIVVGVRAVYGFRWFGRSGQGLR